MGNGNTNVIVHAQLSFGNKQHAWQFSSQPWQNTHNGREALHTALPVQVEVGGMEGIIVLNTQSGCP